jgi:hypothetical protein
MPLSSKPVTRDDIERLEKAIDGLRDDLRKATDVQVRRMAQLQADIDLIRSAWAKVKSGSEA